MASTLLEPLRHPLAGFFLTDELTAVGLAKATLNLIEQVQPVDSVLDTSVIWKLFDSLQDLLLGFHNAPPDQWFDAILAQALWGANPVHSSELYIWKASRQVCIHVSEIREMPKIPVGATREHMVRQGAFPGGGQ